MTGLTGLLFNGITAYGIPALGIMLLLGTLGLPVPATLLVIAAGALARQGVIDGGVALGIGLAAVVLGDTAGYVLGRLAGGRVQGGFSRSAAWRRAQTGFKQSGALAVFTTRFLLTPLALPTNLIAGGSAYIFRRFLVVDVAGELTWLLVYGGLGYSFGSQWQEAGQMVSSYSGWLGITAVAAIAGYWLVPRLLKPIPFYPGTVPSKRGYYG